MSAPQQNSNLEHLSENIKASLQKVEQAVQQREKTYTRLSVAGIVGSAGATLVAAGTAAAGPAAQIGTSGWRTACIVAAVFSFVATVSTALNQQFSLNEKLAKGKECAGRLKYLNALLAAGNVPAEKLTQEYGDIIKAYPDWV